MKHPDEVHELILAIQINKSKTILESIGSERCSEDVCFHLIRRIGMPGASTYLKNLLSSIQKELGFTKSSDVTLSTLEKVCIRNAFIAMEQSSFTNSTTSDILLKHEQLNPLISYKHMEKEVIDLLSLLCTSNSSDQLVGSSHPISLLKPHIKYDKQNGVEYVEFEDAYRVLEISYPDVAISTIAALLNCWSIQNKVLDFTTIERFYFLHGFCITVHTICMHPIDPIIIYLKPSDSTHVLYKVFLKNFLAKLQQTYHINNLTNITDIQFFLDEFDVLQGTNPLTIHDNVLLIQVLPTDSIIYVKSPSTNQILSQKHLLSKSLHNPSLPIHTIELPLHRTITLPSPPPFLHDESMAFEWSVDIIVKYCVEVIELSMYKHTLLSHAVNGDDFIRQSVSYRSAIDSITNYFHKLKFEEYSRKLLFAVLVKTSVSKKRPDQLSSWSSLNIASLLFVDYKCTNAAVLIVRLDLSGRKLCGMSQEELQSYLTPLHIHSQPIKQNSSINSNDSLECINNDEFVTAMEVLTSFTQLPDDDGIPPYATIQDDSLAYSISSDENDVMPPSFEAVDNIFSSFQGNSLEKSVEIVPIPFAVVDSFPTAAFDEKEEDLSASLVVLPSSPLPSVAPSSHELSMISVGKSNSSGVVLEAATIHVNTSPVAEDEVTVQPVEPHIEPPISVAIDAAPHSSASMSTCVSTHVESTHDIVKVDLSVIPQLTVVSSVPETIQDIEGIIVTPAVTTLAHSSLSTPIAHIAPIAPKVPNAPKAKERHLARPLEMLLSLSKAYASPFKSTFKSNADNLPLSCILVRWTRFGFFLLDQWENCSTSGNLALAIALNGVVKCAQLTCESTSSFSTELAIAVGFVVAFLLKYENSNDDEDDASIQFYCKLVLEGSLPIRDTTLQAFRTCLSSILSVEFNIEDDCKLSVSELLEGSVVTFRRMVQVSVRTQPFTSLELSSDESTMSICTFLTLISDYLLSQHNSFKTSLKSLLSPLDVSTIPLLVPPIDPCTPHADQSKDRVFADLIKNMSHRFFDRMKRLSLTAINSIPDMPHNLDLPHNAIPDLSHKQWLKTMRLLKSQLTTACALLSSAYLASDSNQSTPFVRFERVVTLFVAFRIKSLESELVLTPKKQQGKMTNILQKLNTKITECIQFSVESSSAFTLLLAKPINKIYTEFMLEFGVCTSSLIHRQARLEERISTFSSLPSRLRSECIMSDDIRDIVCIENNIMHKNRVLLIQSYESQLNNSIEKITELLNFLSEIWNFAIDNTSSKGVISKGIIVHIEKQLSTVAFKIEELNLKDSLEDQVQSLYAAFQSDILDDAEHTYVKMFSNIVNLESASSKGKKDISLLMEAIIRKL